MKKMLAYFFPTSMNKSSKPSLGEKRESKIIDRSFFLKLIEMERYRVHRSNQQFSLILFNVDEDTRATPPTNKLVNVITRRVRRIDQVGWFDDCRIGVLLPNTSQTGAQIIAKIIATDICSEEQKPKDHFLFETLSYPDNHQLKKRN